jgi:predicted negative regulator of RcsB-dependent stress response
MNFSYDTIASLLDLSLDKALAYKKMVFGIVAGVTLVATIAVGFTWYWRAKQEAAQKDFFELLSHHGAQGEHKWAIVEKEAAQAYERNKRAGIGPMFKIYQADALAAQGRHDQATAMLEGVVKDFSSRPLQDFMQLKLALMKLDNTKAAEQAEGLEQLKAIAENGEHFANEAGLYYLGYFFFVQKDMQQARNYWQQLMVKYGMKDMRQQSGFAEQTRSKLKLISADW